MKYLFILGRNPELSILELKSLFGMFKFEKIGNAILADFGSVTLDKYGKNVISRLGGTIAIGEVLASEKDFEKDLKSKTLSYRNGNRLNYVLWEFIDKDTEFFEEVRLYLKSRFREERFKATEKKIFNRLKLSTGEEVSNLSSRKLIDEQYFVFKNFFGRIIQTCDYEQIEKLDMEKPVRREELAISPRLAKIMINLSKVKSKEILVDSFCGVGTILQEALSQGIYVIGVDKDFKAIDGLKKNLKLLKFPEENYQLFNTDSTKVRIERANVFVSEPDLGEILRGLPNESKTKEILSGYESLIIAVINNLKRSVSGRFVFTSPFIKTSYGNKTKRIGCNKEKILEKTGFRFVSGFPLAEYREDQIVGREIFVLER